MRRTPRRTRPRRISPEPGRRWCQPSRSFARTGSEIAGIGNTTPTHRGDWMRISRRRFVQTSVAAAAAAGCGVAPATPSKDGTTDPDVPAPIRALKPYPGKAVPISDEERRARIEKARRFMADNGIGAIVLEPGTSMNYFVNVRWGTSERPFLLFIPEGLRAAAPQLELVLATPVTAGCRMIKSPAEIALMQRANDITIEAFKAAFSMLVDC